MLRDVRRNEWYRWRWRCREWNSISCRRAGGWSLEAEAVMSAVSAVSAMMMAMEGEDQVSTCKVPPSR